MKNEDVEAVFKRCSELIDKKNTDYAKVDDFYYNFRTVEDQLSIPMWVGIVIRYLDKHSRLTNAVSQFNKTGKIHLENETMEDTLMDGINYLALTLVTYNEWKDKHEIPKKR